VREATLQLQFEVLAEVVGRSRAVQRFDDRLRATVERFAPAHRARGDRDVARLLLAGAKSIRDLAEILRDPRSPIADRERACWALGRLGARSALPALRSALLERSPRLRAEAARSLLTLGDRRAAPALLTALVGDRSRHVREAAALALGGLRAGRAVGPLVRVLADAKAAPQVRGAAAEALGKLGNRIAIRPLVAALADGKAEVRYWAAFALGELSATEALPALRVLAARDGTHVRGTTVKREAAEAIRTIRIGARSQRPPRSNQRRTAAESGAKSRPTARRS
jgi:HEAT repeat protein